MRQTAKIENTHRGYLAIATCVVTLVLPAVALAATAHVTIANAVRVEITDKTLFVSPHQLTQTGPAEIFVVNNGHELHVLTIKGPGLKGVQTDRVPAGGSDQLHLKLLAGSYTITVGFGMSAVRNLVVTSNIVGPPVSATTVPKTPTNAVASPGMAACDL